MSEMAAIRRRLETIRKAKHPPLEIELSNAAWASITEEYVETSLGDPDRLRGRDVFGVRLRLRDTKSGWTIRYDGGVARQSDV
jgi:hypothetical protein